jgi:hypothetical protein
LRNRAQATPPFSRDLPSSDLHIQQATMNEFLTGVAICLCLTSAALLCLWLHPKLPQAHREERTHGVVKIAVGMIVVMTSLVLGLLISSVKTIYDGVDSNVHAFSTQLILLDRALKLYGPETIETRRLLADYVERALNGTWPQNGQPAKVEDQDAGQLLDDTEQSLKRIEPTTPRERELWSAALQRLTRIVELRWTLIEQSGGTVSTPLLVMLVAWLTLISASFGYNAPRNAIVVITLILCTTSVAAAVFLIIEMDKPFTGAIKVSPEPIERALAFMRR